jgi:flavodoxin
MNALVVYDSAYGNTKQVAEAIVASLGPLRAQAVSVADFKATPAQAATWAKDLLNRVGQ